MRPFVRLAVVVASSVVACSRRADEHGPTPAAVATPAPTASASTAAPSATASVAPAPTFRAKAAYGIVVAPAAVHVPVVYLHGMWASPEDSCSFFEAAAARVGPLVCPRGNLPPSAGGAWGGALSNKRVHLDAALAAAAAHGPLASEGVLLGFSSGALFALELALHEPGRWPGLVLMSMHLSTSAAALQAAKVRRVVLAAGEQDGSFAHLRALATTLDAGGVPTRFVTLGKVGHHFAVDMEARMTDAIAWVRGG